MVPARTLNPVWSPDSKWVAYSSRLRSLYHAIFVSNVETGESKQVTDGLADAVWPAWDASGKYLWFLASTDFGLRSQWLDMTSYDHIPTFGLYFAVLHKSEIAGKQDARALVLHSEIGVGVRCGPGFEQQCPPAEIEARLVAHQLGRRNDLHAGHGRVAHDPAEGVDVERPARREPTRQVLVSDESRTRRRKRRVSKHMVGMQMCVDDVADRLIGAGADRGK